MKTTTSWVLSFFLFSCFFLLFLRKRRERSRREREKKNKRARTSAAVERRAPPTLGKKEERASTSFCRRSPPYQIKNRSQFQDDGGQASSRAIRHQAPTGAARAGERGGAFLSFDSGLVAAPRAPVVFALRARSIRACYSHGPQVSPTAIVCVGWRLSSRTKGHTHNQVSTSKSPPSAATPPHLSFALSSRAIIPTSPPNQYNRPCPRRSSAMASRRSSTTCWRSVRFGVCFGQDTPRPVGKSSRRRRRWRRRRRSGEGGGGLRALCLSLSLSLT